jgi:hypothetical protein
MRFVLFASMTCEGFALSTPARPPRSASPSRTAATSFPKRRFCSRSCNTSAPVTATLKLLVRSGLATGSETWCAHARSTDEGRPLSSLPSM